MDTPTGLGKMTLKEVCKRYDIDLNKAVEILNNEGFDVSLDSNLRELASQKGLTPVDIYNIIKNNKF